MLLLMKVHVPCVLMYRWTRVGLPCFRPLALLTCDEKHASHTSDRQFIVFYQWPTMKLLRVISRLKAYQVVTMTMLLGPLTYWYNVGEVSSAILWCAYTSTLGITAVLCTLSYTFGRLVGELAYCQNSNTVRLSTLTFTGRRKDCELPAHSIVPYSDSHQGSSNGLLQRLDIIDPHDVYYYSIRYGHVLDWNLMKKALEIHV